MADLRIIAKRGDQYLLVGKDVKDEDQDPEIVGQILDVEQGKLFPPATLETLLAAGYWEDYEGDESELDDLLAQVEGILFEPRGEDMSKQTAETVSTGPSLEEVRMLVSRALDEKYSVPASVEHPGDFCWIRDLFADTVVYEHKWTLWSASYTIDRTADPARAIVGDPVEVRIAYVKAAEAEGYPSAAFLSKLKELLKAKVKDGDLSAEDFDECVRKARSHAGGMARAEKIRGAKKEEGKGDDEDGDGMDDMDDGDAMGKGKKKDENRPGMMAGELVDLCATGRGSRLFLELSAFVDAPKWLPVLPVPGSYKHPTYGEIKITRARNERFVSNFNAGIYQERIPIDAEHETKVSGALGWIVKMRLNEDGSADGKVEWNDRGETMLAEDRFAYVSPEWYDKWVDPVDGQEYSDVLIGAALTTRPFFKEKALRPIVAASEGGLLVVESPSAAFTSLSSRPEGREPMDKDKETPQSQMSEEVARRFADLEAKVAAEKAAREKAEADAKAAAERVIALELDARKKRFTDVVLGNVEGGRRWFGEAEKHVAHLMKLAAAFGEDSEEVKHYREAMETQAAQIAESELLKTKGSSAPAATSSAWTKIQARAKALREADPKLSEAQAIDRAARENPSLYTEHLRETGADTGE